MNMSDNKHCTETKWSCRYHYKRYDGASRACGVNDDPDCVELRVKPRGYPQLNFELPRQKHELDRVDTMLEYAYERGRNDNRVELASLLKSLISL